MADQPQRGGKPKLATPRAPRLRGNANRLATVARHERRLDTSRASVLRRAPRLLERCTRIFFVFRIVQRKQIAHRAVLRSIALSPRWQGDLCFRRQALPERRRKVCHLLHIKFALSVERMINLPAAIGGLTERLAKVG